jgi:hypothetical protein
MISLSLRHTISSIAFNDDKASKRNKRSPL